MAALCEDLDDAAVGLKNMHAHQFVEADFCGEFPGVIDRGKHREAVLLARRIVVRAVAGSDVDRAGASLGGDEVRQDQLRRAVEKWMPGLEAVELLAFAFLERFGQRIAGFFRERTHEFSNDYQRFDHIILDEFTDDVGEFWMHGDAEIRRQRPRGGGPDDHRCDASQLTGDEWKLDENRRTFLVRVFDFSLSESGLCAVGPLHRLLRLIDRTIFHELRKHP